MCPHDSPPLVPSPAPEPVASESRPAAFTVPAPEDLSPEERERIAAVLAAEYGVLAGLVGAVWSASLVRTSLLLAVISAVGVALGFASQAGGGIGPTFTAHAWPPSPCCSRTGTGRWPAFARRSAR